MQVRVAVVRDQHPQVAGAMGGAARLEGRFQLRHDRRLVGLPLRGRVRPLDLPAGGAPAEVVAAVGDVPEQLAESTNGRRRLVRVLVGRDGLRRLQDPGAELGEPLAQHRGGFLRVGLLGSNGIREREQDCQDEGALGLHGNSFAMQQRVHEPAD